MVPKQVDMSMRTEDVASKLRSIPEWKWVEPDGMQVVLAGGIHSNTVGFRCFLELMYY